ncbi:MAG: transglycosylase SLT domain-containing protein [candidate division Zixibacteria bacterium]|nr:transglycosylase SLT domain-containing protein [candidate division Zixibacteria bacterium]
MITGNVNIDQALAVATDQDEHKLKKAIRGFESMFVLQLLKSMRSAYLSGGSKSGLGKDTFMSIADQALADYIGKNDGLGMAKLLEQHFNKLQDSRVKTDVKTTDPKHIPLGESSINSSQNIGQIKKALENLINLEHDRTAPNKIFYKVNREDDVKPAVEPQTISAEDETVSKPNNVASEIEDAVSDASKTHGLPKNLIEAIIKAESNGNPKAVSPKGAKGLMQLVDTTAADMGVVDTFDVKQNVMGGSKYMKMLLNRFKGDLKLALAAYNAGPGNVEKHDGIPPFKETINYVDKVLKFMNEGDLGKDSKLKAENSYKEEGWSFSTKR